MGSASDAFQMSLRMPIVVLSSKPSFSSFSRVIAPISLALNAGVGALETIVLSSVGSVSPWRRAKRTHQDAKDRSASGRAGSVVAGLMRMRSPRDSISSENFFSSSDLVNIRPLRPARRFCGLSVCTAVQPDRWRSRSSMLVITG